MKIPVQNETELGGTLLEVAGVQEDVSAIVLSRYGGYCPPEKPGGRIVKAQAGKQSLRRVQSEGSAQTPHQLAILDEREKCPSVIRFVRAQYELGVRIVPFLVGLTYHVHTIRGGRIPGRVVYRDMRRACMRRLFL
jgi:hypothetical protein